MLYTKIRPEAVPGVSEEILLKGVDGPSDKHSSSWTFASGELIDNLKHK